MKNLYNALIKKLTSNQAENSYKNAGVSPVKFIDLYRGQYLNWEAFDTFPLPAILVEYAISYVNDDAIATLTFHLCYEQPRDTSSISKSKDDALNFFDFVNTTFELLIDFESKDTGKLELLNEETVKDDAIVTVCILSYQCKYSGRNINPYEDTVKGEYITMDKGLLDTFK